MDANPESLEAQLKALTKRNRQLEREAQRQREQLERIDKIANANEKLNVKLYQELESLSRQLAEEKQRAEGLLLNILPASIAERLKRGPEAIADGFPAVTVLFSDLVGFTPLSETVSPQQLVKLLNDLFSAFDDLSQRYGLEKIKTIGDAYMVAGGLPEYRADHAQAVADMALEMRRVVQDFNANAHLALQMRIGLNTGPVVAGVIGKTKFIYDLWGDTVNTAARMESSGTPGEIQVSASTYDLLHATHDLTFRGLIDVKGKGQMPTYFLQGRKDAKLQQAS
jgi:class 3 adenylate cyclase